MPRPVSLLLLAVAAGAATPPALAASPVAVREAPRELAARIEVMLADRAPPRSLFEAERIAEEAAERARAFLRSEGYYAARVTPGADAAPSAWINVDPGALFRFDPPALDFEGEPPDQATLDAAARALAPVAADAPARARDVLAAEQAVLAALRSAGYADAQADERRVVVDHASARAIATFRFAAGERARLGLVQVSPSNLIKSGLVREMTPWRPGDLYAPEKLTQLRRNVLATGAFAAATPRLAETPDAEGRRDVVLALEPIARRTIEFGAGYSTTEGAGGDIEWTRRNAMRRAETLTLGTTLSEQRQSARAELAFPHGGGVDRTVHYSLQAVSEDAGPFERDALSAAWSIDATPRRKVALSYGLSASAEFYSAAAGVENAYILTSFAEARAETADSRLDARQGYRADARIEPAVSFGDATIPFVRTIAEARFYETPDFAPAITFAARARTGWVAPLGGDDADLPLDRLFYSGGGGSVRGYAYNSIFPEAADPSVDPPGGRGVLELSTEARARLGRRFGLVGFVDGGAAFNDFEETDLRWGAGVGVRYDLGFAPVRFDIAVPIDPRATDDDYALYLSVGQAF